MSKIKTISIGDLHGSRSWSIINPKDYDRIIFVGDYVDSFTETSTNILDNLLNIIQFKEDNNDKVILLWGNHDIQYSLGYDKHGCSGYRPEMKADLYEVFKQKKHLFQMAYQINDTLWTHAGIHQGWAKYRYKKHISEETLNYSFLHEDPTLFDVGHRRGGWHDVGGPFWCDIQELKSSALKGFNQIVGHNRVQMLSSSYQHNKEITFIDCVDTDIDKPTFFIKEFDGT
jgi:hypothetical protein